MKVKVNRSLHLVSATSAARKETFRGRDYLAIPVVALVEGVIWPVNAESPEYVTADAYSMAPEGWNGRPVFPGHPVRGGTQVLGNTPEILEKEQFGYIFNAGVVDGKLTMEAWLNAEDAEAAGEHAVEIYTRAEAGEPIEISVGAIVLMEEVEGEYNGTAYSGKWLEVIPDHLALLPNGDIGACSISMGCGVRTATVHRMAAKGYELVNGKEKEVPEKDKKEKPARRSLKDRLLASLRTLAPAGRSDSEVRSELLEALEEKEPRLALYGWVVDVYENEGLVVYCMYDEEYDMDLYVRDYKWDGKTAIIGDLYAEVEAHTVYEIEDDENQANEVLITQLRAAQKLTPKTAAAPCGCGNKTTTTPTSATTGDTGMKTRDERITALIAASAALVTTGKTKTAYAESDRKWLTDVPDAHFETIEKACSADAPPPNDGKPHPNDGGTKEIPTKPAEPKPKETVAEAAPETQEQFLARNPEIKRMVDRQLAQDKSRRTYLVGKLKTAQTEYDEAALTGMPLDELERLGRLLKATGPEPVSDYSGIATPHEVAASDSAPKAPDFNAAVRAATGKTKAS